MTSVRFETLAGEQLKARATDVTCSIEVNSYKFDIKWYSKGHIKMLTSLICENNSFIVLVSRDESVPKELLTDELSCGFWKCSLMDLIDEKEYCTWNIGVTGYRGLS